MILEIEYYKGDTLLSGKATNVSVLRKQLSEVEKTFDRSEDNFIELLCRLYGWTVVQASVQPDHIYDRDTQKLIGIKK